MKCFVVGIAAAALCMLLQGRAAAQGCCTVGASSLGGFEGGVQPYKTLAATFNYQFNSVSQAYRERQRISDPLRRTAEVGYFNLQFEYGLEPRVSILASINYSGKRRELTVSSGSGTSRFAETATFKGSGIGDLTLLAKYQLITPTITSPFELAIGGGASLPTGSFTQEQNGVQLSLDLQPGTGAPALIAWAFAMQSFPELGFRMIGASSYRYAGTNLDGYRIGDEIIIHLGGEYSLTDFLGASLYLKSRFARQDYAARRVLSATGGSYHDLMPGLNYQDGPSSFRLFGQLPVYRNVRGIQLAVSYLIGVEYTFVFDFSAQEKLLDH